MSVNLAVFGEPPVFAVPQNVGFPIVEEDTRQRFHTLVDEAFARNHLTNDGPFLRQLETKIADLQRVEHCAAVSNGTAAQMLIMKAMNLQGEVILPSFTFVATVQACLWQNLTPVFCDISRDTLTIDPDKVEKLITPKTSAVIGVHLFGNFCDVDRLTTICRKHGIKLVFDAAHSFGCTLEETPVGGFGDAEFLSFHATKFFSTFEGGAVLTNDANLDHQIRSMRNFGFRSFDDVPSIGINAKMNEASAAMGLASLPAITGRIKRLKEIHGMYSKALEVIPGIDLLRVGDRETSNYHYVVVMVDKKKFGVSRDVLASVMWKENVFVRKYFHPGCHRMQFYREAFPDVTWTLPVTEDISDRVLCLPSNLENGEQDAFKIVTIFKIVNENAEEVSQWGRKNLST